ncbi:MAG: hypothetical protein A3F84_29335 [Candidatus Handelsmanbacteria bacterium RIFCSPLOWO2_12_FULL_64_10]|uniref:DNA repair protein n=1 Tax=Handelsmanbacteria sp. (strain RIFCSPLOWO2_12_FULL_64_10) TaxID=1817868 RepID=A0A1F6D2K5_HANXR|nr:MAG: hypothetical protein A3F84_29335 [Candidatus Handelsmanbacteria bacterium RIFCSPLOWO2_12_FULL_64_10]
MNSQVERTTLTLCCARPLQDHEATQLRGFFGGRYRNRPEFHHHGQAGLIYRHPLVQYKTIGGVGRVAGIGAGSFLLQAVDSPRTLTLNGETVEVLDTHRHTEVVAFGPVEGDIEYRFLTPWLALNEENYQTYKQMRLKTQRSELLNRVLVGNLLSLCKSLDIEVTDRLRAEVSVDGTEEVKIKQDVSLLGVRGTFRVNFTIPEMWGIGKQSARGFGTVHRIGG